jgi:hypothetical protein
MGGNNADKNTIVDAGSDSHQTSWVNRVNTTTALGILGGGPLVAADVRSGDAISKVYEDKYAGRGSGADGVADARAAGGPKSWVQKLLGTTTALGMLGGGPLVYADKRSGGAISKLYDDKYAGRG